MIGHGTGAIMAVPAHDQRDYDFAKKYDLPTIEVIKEEIFPGSLYRRRWDGKFGFPQRYLTNKQDSIARMLEFIAEKGFEKQESNLKWRTGLSTARDTGASPFRWSTARTAGVVAVPEEELPLKLPDVENYEPGKTVNRLFAKIPSFVNCKCPKCGGDAKRETDTMPQYRIFMVLFKIYWSA